MTDRQAIEHLRAVRMFCSAQQVLAMDRAIELLQERMKEETKTHPVV